MKFETTPQQYKFNKRVRLPSLRAIAFLWLPALMVAGAMLLPILYLMLRALQAEAAVSLILRQSTFETTARTLWLAAAVTLASTVIAVPLAWLTTRTDLPGRRIWAILTALPIVIPSYVGAYLLASTLGPRGALQKWLEPLGVMRLPAIYGFPGALFILTILSYPYILLGVRAALQNMDPAQEEAARSLGLNRWQVFWRVILPNLRPSIVAGGLLVSLYVLRDFGAVSVMRYNTFTRVIYLHYKSTFDRSAAAVLSLVLVLITILLLYFEERSKNRAKYHSSSLTSQRPLNIVSLGRWKPAAVTLVFLISLAGVIIPAFNLGFWLLRGLFAGEIIPDLGLAARNSILAASLAALAALIAALPIAILSVRYANRVSKAIRRMTYLAFALPGIVIALALVFFGANYIPFLYQTLFMLVFAYLILFVPESVGIVQSALLQIHPSLEEAGRSLGHHPFKVFQRITLPLLRPGILASMALVFLTTLKELPATLILAPIGFKTLSTSVWSAVSEAFFAQAAAPALLIILASSLPMALMIFNEKNIDTSVNKTKKGHLTNDSNRRSN